MKKVMVFIDGSNMYHNLRACAGRNDIDYEKFAQKLCGPHRELIRTYYYNVQLNQAADPAAYAAQQKFLSWMNKTPDLDVRLGRQQKKSNGTWEEKGVDVKIAVDMLTKASKVHYDVGEKVRQTIQELGGTMPEELPTPESSINQIEKRKKKID